MCKDLWSTLGINEVLNNWERKNFSAGRIDNEEPEKARKGWQILEQKEDGSIIWQTQSGKFLETFGENGKKRLTRIISAEEKQEIEKNWPKAE